MTTTNDVREIQLLEPGTNLSTENASFTLTTTSWQRNSISFFHESIVYTFLCLCIGIFGTVILFSLIYHHIIYEVLGLMGFLIIISLCFCYYIKHCFGICFQYKNKIIFNETTNNVEIHRNGEFIQAISFDEYDGLSYHDHYVYINIKQRDAIPLNIYRCDSKKAKDFVLLVTDIWHLMKKKYQKAEFQPISIV